MAYQQLHRQEGRANTNQPTDVSFEVEEIDCDPTRKGYTQVPNYFAYYWTPLLGAKAALTYERICSFAHGKKDECYPSISFLADTLAVDRHDLTGRNRCDHRPGRKGAYYQKGFIEILAEHRLLRVEIEDTKSGPHYRFKVQKYPPLLTAEQLAQLPPRHQRKHQELLDRCQKEREEFARPAVVTPPQGGGDAVTGGGVTPPQGGGDAATGINKTQRTTQKKQLSPTTTEEAEKVREFYQQIGQPKVSQQKVNAGVQTISTLKSQGFNLVEVLFAMNWIVSHQDSFEKKVQSLGLLPHVISQAVQEKDSVETRVAKRQQLVTEEQKQEAEMQRRQELERLYQSLSSSEQAALREVAVEGLLGKGIKKSFLLESLVKSEICRLLGEGQRRGNDSATALLSSQHYL